MFDRFKSKLKFTKKRFIAMMSVVFMSIPIIGYAITVSSTSGTQYMNYDSISAGTVVPINGYRYYGPNSEVFYCLNNGLEHPNGQDFTQQMATSPAMTKLMYWGYPAMSGSYYGITDDQLRYATQVAVWCLVREEGGHGLVRSRLQGGSALQNKLKGIIDDMVEKAKAGTVPTVFKLSDTNLTATLSGDALLTQPVKIISDYGIDDCTITLSDKSAQVVDVDGSPKSTFKAGESFRIKVPKNAKTGTLTATINGSVPAPASISWKSPQGGMQNMLQAYTQPQPVTNNVINVSWEGLNGNVELTKTTAGGAPLQGAVFSLYNEGGQEFKSGLTTDGSGKIVVNDIPTGKYYFQETKAPEGYVLNSTKLPVTVESGQTAKVSLSNKKVHGTLKLRKEDMKTKKALEGAEFGLFKGDNQIKTATTDKFGYATFKDVEYGDYVIKETKAPVGYVIDISPINAKVAEDNKTYTFEHPNKIIQGYVEIVKSDAEIKDLKIGGAEFTIYDSTGKAVTTLTTDKDGHAKSGLLDYGKYTMRETKAPTGYLPNNQTWDINISEEGKVYTYNITNQVIKGKIQIVKVDANHEENPVEGAGFDVLAENVFGVAKGTKVAHIKTNKDGFAFTGDLRYGKYAIKETETPNGFWHSDKTYYVDIAEAGKTVVRYISNKPVEAKLRMIKTDGTTKKPLAGAEFQIIDTKTNKPVEFKKFTGIVPTTIKSLTTDERGEFLTPQPLPAGNYIVKEIKAPVGYLPVADIKFTLDNQTSLEDIKDLGTILTVKAVDERIKGNLEIVKTDSRSKKALEGVTFEIKCLEGFDKGKTWTKVTDKDGKIKLENLFFGKYTATETKTLEGYVLDSTPIPFSIEENGKTITKEMTNKPIEGDIEITKADLSTGKVLANAEFTIYDESGKVVTKGNTGEDGKAKFHLDYGKYFYQETGAPEGFVLDDTKFPFEIKEDGQIIKCTMKDKPIEGQIIITKEDVSTGEKLPNTHFVIRNDKGEIVQKGVTDKNGEAKFKLKYGKYTYQEYGAPLGYVLDDTQFPFEIKEDGQIIKCLMKDKPIEGEIEITKMDVSTGALLPNTEFTIYDENKQVVTRGVTDSNGVFKFKLKYGTYYYQETQAPEGYQIDNGMYKFKIEKDGVIVKAVMKDAKLPKTGVSPSHHIGLFVGGLVILGCVGYFGVTEFRKRRHNK